MLQMNIDVDNAEAYDIVHKFINDRLIALMEYTILDEIDWRMAIRGELDEDSAVKTFDEMVDINDLMMDMQFAEDVSLDYLPDGYPKEKANQEFFGLYKLLKAKKDYVPELPMEYVLASLINSEIYQIDMIARDTADGVFDDLMDDPMFEGIEDEELTTVEHIPEPDRTVVLNALRVHCEKEYDPEEVDDAVEYCMNQFEDLRQYGDICFWDEDYLFLDEMDADSLAASELNKQMGILPQKKSNVIEFPISGKDGKSVSVKAEININIHPWDLEDD